jgi:hypothetical protein
MGGDTGWGESGANRQAQNTNVPEGVTPGIPLPQTRTINNAAGGVAAAQVQQPGEDAMAAAQGYNPNVGALNAPDDDPSLAITAGLARRSVDPTKLSGKRVAAANATILERLALAGAEGYPEFMAAAEGQRARATSQ